MKLSLDLRTSLSQTLTPQQIQYLKLLQLPMIQLEQHVMQEIEQNPMLEEIEQDIPTDFEEIPAADLSIRENLESDFDSDGEPTPKSMIDDAVDPFEFYKMLWQDDSSYDNTQKNLSDEGEDNEFFQIKDVMTIAEELLQQLKMTKLSEEETILGEQIIGNVDNDGYFRASLEEIIQLTNEQIAEINFAVRKKIEDEKIKEDEANLPPNPARQYAVSQEAIKISKDIAKETGAILYDHIFDDEEEEEPETEEFQNIRLLNPVTLEQAEYVLKLIQTLDPPGFASRNIQECLVAQCKNIPKKNAAQKLAMEILENAYEPFAMKHYQQIIKQIGVTEEYLKEAIEVIKRLNPNPGGIDTTHLINTVIPDFLIQRDEDTDELLINVNDSRLPILRLNQAYEKLKKEAKIKVFNKETRDWIRNKYEDAKFLIQAIRQRKNTMLKVMTAIAQLQKNFFYEGHSALKPLIYKDVSEETGLDISTVCRIVNGKYVQTEFGTFELKFFFSESLPSDDGEEISTTVIKQVIKDLISQEPKDKPFSDDKIGKELQKKGYQIARRTVAKYREQLKIPVARLRREL
jgi:RNA polymerase sigma-54 factor